MLLKKCSFERKLVPRHLIIFVRINQLKQKGRAFFFTHMRKLLLVYILAFLWVLPAKTILSIVLYPERNASVISFSQQGESSVWDGQVSFSASDGLCLSFPSRFKIGRGDTSLSMGYAGFWQEYALLPFFSNEQTLFYQSKKHAVALFSKNMERRAIGYEYAFPKGKLSALAWMHPEVEVSSFQTEWGAAHAPWGVGGKLLLKTQNLSLHAESLFTPVQGLEAFMASSFTYAACKANFAYGEKPYPLRYSLSLALQSHSVRATFMMEDWFGSKPIYGGTSATRRTRESASLRFSLGRGYLLVSFSDMYEFKRRGSEMGSVLAQVKLGGPLGQLTLQYAANRRPLVALDGEFKVSFVLNKASFSYSSGVYEITLSDSVAIGKGIGTWKLHKSMGKAVSLTLMYALTIDR